MASSSSAPKIFAALCNAPDGAAARKIAKQLVRDRLAACVNILPPCRSVYRWRGKIAADSESPMLIKTTAANIPALKDAIRRLHPYDTPELIFLRVQDGLPDYLQWVQEECESQKD